VLRGRRTRRLSVQVLVDERIDLRPALGGQGLDELRHRLHAMSIAIEDCLDSRHSPSIAEEIDRDLSVNQGHRKVVADDDGEEDGVEAVEEAAVGAEDGAGVLGAEVALQHRLEEVAERGGGGDGGAD